MDPEFYATASIADLIFSMLPSMHSDRMPSRNLWGFVRRRLITHKLEACVLNDFPVIENGKHSLGTIFPLQAALCIKVEELRIPYDVLVKLVEAFPHALKTKTNLGLTPLHLAVNIGDIELAKYVLWQYPDAVQHQSKTGLLPLHLAKNAAIARMLLEIDYSGVSKQDQYGNTPLHLAICSMAYAPGVVDLLLKWGIECNIDGSNEAGGALTKNGLNYSPLQVAIDNVRLGLAGRSSIDVEPAWKKLQCCLYAVSISRRYYSGSMLHICMESLVDKNLLRFAIEKCNSEIFSTNICGRFPLHIACMSRKIPGSIIDTLVTKYPAATTSFDSDYKLPLHYAICSGRDFNDGLNALVRFNSLALSTKCKQTNLFPFMMAAENQCSSINSIYGLLRADPNCLLTSISARKS